MFGRYDRARHTDAAADFSCVNMVAHRIDDADDLVTWNER